MRRRGARDGGSRWRPRDPDHVPPPPRPPPAHGIRVQEVGTTWWGQRWVEALEHLSRAYARRLARGHTYARAGRVHDLVVARGAVTARVTGSRPKPYTVTLRLASLDETAWDRAVAGMASQAIFAAELLSGRMPERIDEVFRAAGSSLFPRQERDLRTTCSCPDWANPCKHVAATHYVLGEAFDKDPFLLFELRGRDREAVLSALRRRWGGAEGRGSGRGGRPGGQEAGTMSVADLRAEDYETPRGARASGGFRFDAPSVPAAVLRQLGAPPSWSIEGSVADLLAPVYQAAGALARELALGAAEPPPLAEPVSAPALPAPPGSRRRFGPGASGPR